jgi:hypothetical protein
MTGMFAVVAAGAMNMADGMRRSGAEAREASARDVFSRLSGRKYLIIGNHDLSNKGGLHKRVRDLAWAAPPKAVRAAWKENKLGLVSWNAHHHSTRRLVQEWLASCVTSAGLAPAPRRGAKPIKDVLSKPKVVVEEQFEEREIAKSAASIALAKMMKKKGE